jgi:CubicO group peptidase (beta-lactamase class C family)
MTAVCLLGLAIAGAAIAQVPTAEAPSALPALAASAAPVPASLSEAASLTQADLEAWLDGFMLFALARGDVAGGLVVVVRDGEVLLQKGYGLADVTAGTPMSAEDTLIRPGSVSKLVTWTAVMQQVERGALDLDADVNRYLDFAIPPFEGQPVTLRQLMTHTAGFAETVRHLFNDNLAALMPLEVYLRESLPPRVFAPGTTPAYSNYGTALAGHIVERASGLSFDEYVERHIFAPLGMERSSFRQPLPEALRPLAAQSYDVAGGEAQPYEGVIPGPAGALATSGADMGRFMIAHLEGGRGLMRPETAALMHDTVTRLVPPLNGMALGFYEQEVNGRRWIGHGGDTEFSHAQLMLLPSEGVGVFVAVNSNGTPGTSNALRTALLQEFADRYFPGPPPNGTGVDPATAGRHAAQMAGSWAPSRGSPTTFLSVLTLVEAVTLGVNPDGSLVAPAVTGLADEPQRWVETEPYVWTNAAGDARIAAVVEDGEVVRWSTDAVSPFLVFDRMPASRDPAWLGPAAAASALVAALTALAWPVGALTRWRYGVTQPLRGQDLGARRLTQAFAWLALLVLAGWATFIGLAFASLPLLGGPLDPLLRATQALTPVAFAGLTLAAAWDAARTWSGAHGWGARTWSGLLLVSSLVLLWVAWAFNLIGWDLRY